MTTVFLYNFTIVFNLTLLIYKPQINPSIYI